VNFLSIAILYILSGFLMKLSDDEYDEKSNKTIAIVIGVLCAVAISFLSSNNIEASYIFIGIMIGTGLSLKIDGIHHILTLITFIVLLFIWGIHDLNLATLGICTVSAFIDEIGNDNEIICKKNKFLKVFFEYRLTMKITILILSFLGFYQSFTGFQIVNINFLSISTFICFLLFEISYELAGFTFKNYLN
jgi:chromate transport protein ChrA